MTVAPPVGHGIGQRWVVIGGVMIIAILTGPFGTIALPLPSRTLFWAKRVSC